MLLLASCPARAELNWDQEKLTLKTTQFEKQVPFSFRCKNTGASPIRIVRTATSCGCTVSEASPEIVPVGESSAVKGYYQIGSRQGLYTVDIVIHAERLQSTKWIPFESQLQLQVEISEMIHLSPKVTLWKVGDEARDKSAEISMEDGAGSSLFLADNSNPSYKVSLRAGERPGRYILTGAPSSTSSTSRSMITLQGTRPDGQAFKVYTHFVVRAGAANGPGKPPVSTVEP